ncbi:hypothetical protein M3202_17625 [Alkalihalobacillus oceani]|uniref:Phosphoadenosine phosphosulphate reductase domain-containing protein n=1 Tax=Halalkalibacter oceani TaxID=1653776 RepID=A0A9X2DSY8_9BACI|nr:hypothetical protein [Halalkalibacter oceani]MCM3715877.1 hypothetical protein [Halalkalibacter oceani]
MQQLELLPNDYTQHKKYIQGYFKSKNEIINKLIEDGKDDIYYVLSFGGGTQSAHLLEDHIQGKIHYDFIIFSDTGAEPDFIRKQVDWWKNRLMEKRIDTPFIVTRHSSMHSGLEEMLWRYLETDYERFQMPLYLSKLNENGTEIPAGMTPRQCTIDFKIVPVKQTIRKIILKKYGRMHNQRMPANVAIIQDIGFSYDELNRINMWQSPQYKYIYMAYPLVEQGLTTEESITFLSQNNFPEKRSRCYLCPFNCDMPGMNWVEIIQEEPLSCLKACYFDRNIREVIKSGRKRLKKFS